MNQPTNSGLTATYAPSSTFTLPQHWSAEQALAVWEFLDEVARCVWDRYQIQLVELIHADLESDDYAQPDLFDPDDPIPF